MHKSDDARENSIRSGFLSADTEANTQKACLTVLFRVAMNGEIHTKLCWNVSFDVYSRKQ